MSKCNLKSRGHVLGLLERARAGDGASHTHRLASACRHKAPPEVHAHHKRSQRAYVYLDGWKCENTLVGYDVAAQADCTHGAVTALTVPPSSRLTAEYAPVASKCAAIIAGPFPCFTGRARKWSCSGPKGHVHGRGTHGILRGHSYARLRQIYVPCTQHHVRRCARKSKHSDDYWHSVVPSKRMHASSAH